MRIIIVIVTLLAGPISILAADSPACPQCKTTHERAMTFIKDRTLSNHTRDLWRRMRQNAAGEVPLERTLEAKEILGRMPGGPSGPTLPPKLESLFGRRWRAAQDGSGFLAAPVTLSPWTNLGPTNFAGHINGLVAQPNGVLYAGAASGGVWKSTDAGTTWKPLTDFAASLQVSTLTADPTNPNRLYAGTGYVNDPLLQDPLVAPPIARGAGILVTTDGGKTWSPLASTATPDFRIVTKVLVSPGNSQVLYAATATGVFRSANQGTSWTPAGGAPGGGYPEMAVYDNAGTDNVFAWKFGDTLYRSIDGGLTFAAVGGGFPASPQSYGNIAIVKPATPGPSPHIYCSIANTTQNFSGLFESTDGGATWTQKTLLDTSRQGQLDKALFNNPITFADLDNDGLEDCNGGPVVSLAQGFYDNILFVDPTNATSVWLGAVDLFRSDDAGVNFGVASYWWKAIPPATGFDPNGLYADKHAFAFDPGYNGTTNQTLYIGTDGGVYRTQNAESSVLTVSVNTSPTCGNPPLPGVTFTPLTAGFTVDQFYHGAVSASGTFLMGGLQDLGTQSFNTTASSSRWTSVNGGDGDHVAIDQTNQAIVYFQNANPSIIQKSTDGGATFADATSGITMTSSDFGFFADFAMDPANSQRLWLAGDVVFRTVNGAANWTTVSPTLTSSPIFIDSIAIAPSGGGQIVYVASSAGDVFRTGNGLAPSPVWARINSTLPADFVSAVTVHPTNPNEVYVTYSSFDVLGGQVYRTLDATQGVSTTWSPLIGSGGAAIPNMPVYALGVSPADNNVLLAGTELGVLASADGGATWNNVNSGTLANVPVTDFAFAGNAKVFAFTFGRGVYSAPLNEPVLTATAPANNQTIVPGSTQLVSWTVNTGIPLSADIASFDVGLSTDGGVTFTPLATGLTASTRSFLWSVPGSLLSFGAVIRVTARDASGAALGFDQVAGLRIFTDTTESGGGGCAADRAGGTGAAGTAGSNQLWLLMLIPAFLIATIRRRMRRPGPGSGSAPAD